MPRDLFRRKCAKCNITAAEDKKLSFHRFPLPGKHGISRIRVWAEYCYPNEDWSSEESLKDLHIQHKLVCSKHFDDSCYTNSARKRLNIFAVPTGGQVLSKESTRLVPYSHKLALSETGNAGSFSADKSQDSHTSDLDTHDNNNYEDDFIKTENYEMDTLRKEILDKKLECFEQNDLVLNDTPLPDLQPQLRLEDEFDNFGKNVADQLKTFPLLLALETQEMLLSILKKQQLKVLGNSDPLISN